MKNQRFTVFGVMAALCLTAPAALLFGCGDDGNASSSTASEVAETTTGEAAPAVSDAESVVEALSSAYSSLDASDLTDVLAADVTFSDPTFDDELQGAADVEAFFGTWMGLPDFSYDPTFEISEDGSHLFDWGTWAASGPGGEFAVDILAVYEISDGQITSMTIYYADPGVPESVYQVLGPPPG